MRNEEAGAFAAAAEAQLTGRLAVCAAIAEANVRNIPRPAISR